MGVRLLISGTWGPTCSHHYITPRGFKLYLFAIATEPYKLILELRYHFLYTKACFGNFFIIFSCFCLVWIFSLSLLSCSIQNSSLSLFLYFSLSLSLSLYIYIYIDIYGRYISLSFLLYIAHIFVYFTRINGNFIDKTFSIVANILLRIIPTTSREKEAFTYIFIFLLN